MSVFNIEDETLDNEFFRKVIHTDALQQIALMSIQPREEIGKEVHDNTSLFIRIEQGEGVAVLDEIEYDIYEGDVVVVPAGTEHNVIASGAVPLRLFIVYSGEVLHKEAEVRLRTQSLK
jgi:mannose-6-phosphate isomerase-like protein (cupin superfamily)